jgi:hypothetical protein
MTPPREPTPDRDTPDSDTADRDTEEGGGGRRRIRAETTAATWELGMQAMRAYVTAHGSATPHTHLVVDGFALGRWAARCRDTHRAGHLPPERVAVLQALPGWSWGRTQRDRFLEGLTHLRTYVAQHGTAQTPRNAVVDGFPVGDWAQRRRQAHASGELRPQWAAELEALPGWRWRENRQPFHWANGLTALQGWITEHGDAIVPEEATHRGYPLGAWVHTVRRRHTRGILTAHQVTTLNALPGWVWGEREARFHHGLALLRAYQQETGSASPTQFYIHPCGFTLGAWVGRVRTLHRTGALPPDRIHALQAIPGWQFNPRAAHWDTTLALLHTTAHAHGGLQNIPRHTRTHGVAIVIWADNQRLQGRHGRLTPHQITALDTIPGWWWTPTPTNAVTNAVTRRGKTAGP